VTPTEYWLWLAFGLGFGAVNSGELLLAFPGGAEEILGQLGGDKMDEILTQKQAEKLASSRPEDFALRMNHYASLGIETLGFDDTRYPDALRRINNPPPALFVKGDTSLLNGQLAIGMVGARRPSAYGVEATKALGRGVAMGGAIIVSGLAAGLDAEAHKAALAVNGPTVACIAFGHDQCYPAANRKLMEVIERNGAVVSEYPPGTKPEKPYFLHRNRIIAGISHGLVVVEARRYSGTMSTVNFAIDYGRDVFAVPGSIFSELSGGTNAMIREGAYLAGAAADVLSVYGVDAPNESPADTLARSAFDSRPDPVQSVSDWPGPDDDEYDEVQQAAPAREETLQPEPPEPPAQPRDAVQVMDAFRALQRISPATDNSELEARNRLLDEMVNMVSDQVDFSRREAAPAKPADNGEKSVRPFNWGSVERLEKSQVEDLSAASANPRPEANGRKPSLGSRVLDAGQELPKPRKPLRQPYPAQVTYGAASRVDAVGAVESVTATRAVWPVAMPGPVPNPVARPSPRTEKPPAAPPQKPAAEPTLPPPEKPARAASTSTASLTGRLSTLQGGQPSPGQPKRTDTFTPSHRPADVPAPAAEDPQDLLSDGARRALSQLGAQPVSLATLCEKSGLSSAEAMAALTELELAGLSRQLAGRQFVIMQ